MKKLFFLLPLVITILTVFVFLTGRKSVNEKMLGGIVPHHLLADFIIADFFNNLSRQKPGTIILIGPNHWEKGGMVLSSLRDWDTPSGLLKSNQGLIKDLENKGLLRLNEEILKDEHSMWDIMSFINFSMPETKVVPIILRHNTKLEQLKELADGLSQYLNEKTVLVASIDFSHYLGSQEAQSNDEQTIKAIASHDINKILSYDSDKVDSPASLAVFLISMRNRSYGSYKTLWHANSGEIIGNGRPPTTSYFSLAFY